MLRDTFCGRSCFLAILSAGSGDDERSTLLATLRATAFGLGPADPNSVQWVRVPSSQSSPLLWGAPEGQKQANVPKIVDWYQTTAGKHIAASQIYFYDDKANNVLGFESSGFNAVQVLHLNLCPPCHVSNLATSTFLGPLCKGLVRLA